MIYIKLCIQKNIPNVFGVSCFFGGRPPKIPTFSGSAPERLERGPQYSARRRNFQKSQRTFVVLRLGYNPSTFRYVSRQNPRCPTQKTKKSAVLAHFGTVFNQMGGAPRFSRWASVMSAYPPVQTQNWKHTWEFLKILPTGWDTGVFLRAFWTKIREKRSNSRGRFGNGGGFASQKVLAPLLDSNFNLDYDFATIHDPIQSDDWVMDFCGMPKSRWAPKITIIP